MQLKTTSNLIFRKTGYLPAGSSTYEYFDLSEKEGKLVIIISNEESYNALAEALSNDFTPFAISAALGMPLPVNLANIPRGKDFGYEISCFDSHSKNWSTIFSWSRTIFEYRVIDLQQYPSFSWRVLVDNSFSILTGKTYTIEVYQVKEVEKSSKKSKNLLKKKR